VPGGLEGSVGSTGVLLPELHPVTIIATRNTVNRNFIFDSSFIDSPEDSPGLASITAHRKLKGTIE